MKIVIEFDLLLGNAFVKSRRFRLSVTITAKTNILNHKWIYAL